MNLRHQIFVSSTFTDLVAERQSVINALLRLKCWPAVMEQFTAASQTPWDYITRVLDESDYFIVIVGSRYGSVDAEGIGFTEREFDYAEKIGLPILGFVKHPLPEVSTSSAEALVDAQRLVAFREKVETKLVDRFSDPADLAAKVVQAVVFAQQESPREGWVRAGSLAEVESVELANLRATVATLKLEAQELREELRRAEADEVHTFASGTDTVDIHYHRGLAEALASNPTGIMQLTWDEVFKAIGPKLRAPCKDDSAMRALAELISQREVSDDPLSGATIVSSDTDAIFAQLEATGLIETDGKKARNGVFWILTEPGKARLRDLLATRRTEEPPAQGEPNLPAPDGPEREQPEPGPSTGE
ncbi:DUF4062 domain-containing protein [Tsukamurella strandjordii]|uniref:DUF4062 domain-containing protein n=1 Tax=Tsukamurella strandjordii TaxID=147577 RepID=A0AA90NAX7_9ACTN|nr:DUF4062 domain-containing protein [Tsukamurella strandjordii]MDP0398911.1 DUF4062 domain-containing protein [Tsukamurella strandjordii]